MELIGLNEVVDLLGVNEKTAKKILNLPGCPLLPRGKNESYRIVKEALIRWLENGCPKD